MPLVLYKEFQRSHVLSCDVHIIKLIITEKHFTKFVVCLNMPKINCAGSDMQKFEPTMATESHWTKLLPCLS